MTSDKPDGVQKWRNTTAQTLTAAEFAQKVLENGLRVVGPYEGYVYCALDSDDGYDLFKAYQAKRWVWQSRIVFTQTNAAGGAIKADYSVATGQVARLVSAFTINSGTNGIVVYKRDEDNASNSYLAVIASAAGTSTYLPSIGAAASTAQNIINSTGMMLFPGEKLSFEQTAAGAQNDNMTQCVTLELFNLGTEPTISKARSVNAADVTQGTDSISDANDLQELVC